MKHIDGTNDFLKEQVNLNQSRLNTLDDKIESITNLLKRKLEGYRKYSKQGSYAHGTIIKPVKDNDEFDADILIFIEDDNFDPNNFQEDYVKKVYDVFQENENYKDLAIKKSRCCTLNYSGDFHIDLVPCIEYGDKKYICNSTDEKYEKTDGDGYKKWLSKKNQIVGGNNFKKSTRLLKYLRDHKRNFGVKSIILTTVLGYQVNDYENNSDKFEDLVETLVTLSNRLNDQLHNNPEIMIVKNPVLSDEEFSRDWKRKDYKNFRTKFNDYTRLMNGAYEEKSHNESVRKWRKLFGDKFGKLLDSKSLRVATIAGVSFTTPSPTAFAEKPYLSSNPHINIPASHSYEYSSSEMQKINQYFPYLYYENNMIKGKISFSAKFRPTTRKRKYEYEIVHCVTGKKCVQDAYEIEIRLDDSQSALPKVFEIGGRLENLAIELGKPIADMHLYPQDKSCCLGKFSVQTNETLSSFVIKKVYPYFVWQAYYEKFGEKPPVGDHPH